MSANRATLYRMVLPDHVCSYRVQARANLEQAGYDVDDRQLTSRDEVDQFEGAQNVDTTSQVFIGRRRVGGSDALQCFLDA